MRAVDPKPLPLHPPAHEHTSPKVRRGLHHTAAGSYAIPPKHAKEHGALIARYAQHYCTPSLTSALGRLEAGAPTGHSSSVLTASSGGTERPRISRPAGTQALLLLGFGAERIPMVAATAAWIELGTFTEHRIRNRPNGGAVLLLTGDGISRSVGSHVFGC